MATEVEANDVEEPKPSLNGEHSSANDDEADGESETNEPVTAEKLKKAINSEIKTEKTTGVEEGDKSSEQQVNGKSDSSSVDDENKSDDNKLGTRLTRKREVSPDKAGAANNGTAGKKPKLSDENSNNSDTAATEKMNTESEPKEESSSSASSSEKVTENGKSSPGDNKENEEAESGAPVRRRLRSATVTPKKPLRYDESADVETDDDDIIETPVKEKTRVVPVAHSKEAIVNSKKTIIVTESGGIAQAISNAVRSGEATKQGKPTLVIIETKSPEVEMVPVAAPVPAVAPVVRPQQAFKVLPKTAPVAKPAQSLIQNPAKFMLPPGAVVPMEDGTYKIDVPSLVIPCLVESPSEYNLKLFASELPPMDEDGKLDSDKKDADKEKKPEEPIPTTKLAKAAKSYRDMLMTYFDSASGKFFMDIGLNLAREWVQKDVINIQKQKVKDGRASKSDNASAIDGLLRGLDVSIKENDPYRFKMKKCHYCSYRTESLIVLRKHYETPHFQPSNNQFRCNFCKNSTRNIQEIMYHMEAEHSVKATMDKAPAFYRCPLCPYEDNSKAKFNRHYMKCEKNYLPDKNQVPPTDFDPPAKRVRLLLTPGMLHSLMPNQPGWNKLTAQQQQQLQARQNLLAQQQRLQQQKAGVNIFPVGGPMMYRQGGMVFQQQGNRLVQVSNGTGAPQAHQNSTIQIMNNQVIVSGGQRFTLLPSNNQSSVPTPVALVPNAQRNQKTSSPIASRQSMLQQQYQANRPNISITPVMKPPPGVSISKTSTGIPTIQKQGSAMFVICEICDGYIKDLEQLRNHMQWIHKVKIHPKMIYNRPPLNCQKCQYRFFTDQGLERHLLGAHGLVTSSMQESANKGQDSGRCTLCGRIYQWKLLVHMSKDHNLVLKPAHLSYKCTVCSATFNMYKLFETHVYQAHSSVAKRVLEPGSGGARKQQGERNSVSVTAVSKRSAIADAAKKPEAPAPKFGPASVIGRSKYVKTVFDCNFCDETFNKGALLYKHFEEEHTSAFSVKTHCRVDKCIACQKKAGIKDFQWPQSPDCIDLSSGSEDEDDDDIMSTDDDEVQEVGRRKPGPASKTRRIKAQKQDDETMEVDDGEEEEGDEEEEVDEEGDEDGEEDEEVGDDEDGDEEVEGDDEGGEEDDEDGGEGEDDEEGGEEDEEVEAVEEGGDDEVDEDGEEGEAGEGDEAEDEEGEDEVQEVDDDDEDEEDADEKNDDEGDGEEGESEDEESN